MREKNSCEFSFSGLKTAVALYLKEKSPAYIQKHLADIAASFQEAVGEVLVMKTLDAAEANGVSQVSVSGGVARNKRLREIFEERKAGNLEIFIPSPDLCSDNGAMIAACGSYHLEKGERSDLGLNAVPYLEL
jgi:N6-L-threonylcarbamoyladenine synthase